MDQDKAREDAIAFLKNHNAGVLATVSREGNPQASIIYYVADDDFNIYFFTKIHSRKYESIAANHKAAFTIGREDVPQTLQIEGIVTELVGDGDKAEHVQQIMEMLMKTNQRFIPIAKMDADNVVMWLEPKWIRWGDFSAPGIGNENLFADIPVK